jgi:iron complex transport system substrate-binding protein
MRGLTAARRRTLLGLAACSPLGALSARATAAPPARIVSIGGALTETLFAIGAAGQLVGVDTTSLYPAAARALPSVGYARALSAEGLLSLKPSLVLAAGEAGPPAVLRQIEAARVPLVVLDADHRFEGVVERTVRLGELSGRAEAAGVLAAQMRADWARSQQAVARHTAAGAARPRVLFVLSHAPNQVRLGGRNTAADAMIRYAGGINAFGAADGFKPLAPEAAVAAAPDLILATEQGLAATGGIDGLLALPGLAATPAGRTRRVVGFEALFLLGFGPRLPQAVAALADALLAVPARPV